MPLSRSLTFPAIAAVIAISSTCLTAGTAYARSGQTSDPLPLRFLTVLMPSAAEGQPLQTPSAQPTSPELPDGPGKDVTVRVCSGCHAVTMFSQQRHTPDQWSDILSDMLSRGLDASDADLATIHTYLSTNLAPPKQGTVPPASTSPASTAPASTAPAATPPASTAPASTAPAAPPNR